MVVIFNNNVGMYKNMFFYIFRLSFMFYNNDSFKKNSLKCLYYFCLVCEVLNCKKLGDF